METNNILQGLANNTELMEATKKIILEQFDEVPYSEGASDELLGQISRARHTGRRKVEAAFQAILAFKVIPKTETKQNPAY